jgi:hypothetical protein
MWARKYACSVFRAFLCFLWRFRSHGSADSEFLLLVGDHDAETAGFDHRLVIQADEFVIRGIH